MQDSSPIPRILHFTWGLLDSGRPLPDDYRRQIDTWQRLNPDWTIRVHGAEEVHELARAFPQVPFLDYPRWIQRCDVCRPMLLARHGGLYADLDVTPRLGLDELLAMQQGASCVLLTEVVLSLRQSVVIGLRQRIRRGRPERRRRIANFLMASTPGHPLWDEVFRLLVQRASLPVREDYDVLYTTGPDVITEALARLPGADGVAVLDAQTAAASFHHGTHGSWRRDGEPAAPA